MFALWYNGGTTKNVAPAVPVTPWSMRQPVRRLSVSHLITSHEEEQPLTCVGCGETKSASAFDLLKDIKNGVLHQRRRPKCKACIAARRFELHPPKYVTNPRQPEQVRTCKTCGETKPIEEFPLTESKRNGKVRICRRGKCQACVMEYRNERRRNKTRTRVVVERPLTKICSKCLVEKSGDDFVLCRREKDGLSNTCKQCQKENRKKNKEASTLRVLTWQRNNPEKLKAKQKRYQDKHKEQIRDLVRARTNRRRTRLTQAGGSFTREEWNVLCARYEYRCLCCGEHKKLTADHIVPVSLGGSSNIDNIQPLCGSCNAKKRTQTIDYRPQWEGRNG